ncbi:MAG: RDD family protein [Candidatus Wallbacteria bacterium]|nr:RDD family protein [Candidatus Wallbacteria bacterium]
MKYWYYHESGQQKGPIAEDEFKKLFVNGSLNANTLVWSEGLKEWQEAHTIDNLIPVSFVPPPLPTTVSQETPTLCVYVPSGPQVRPFVRFSARLIDMILYSFLSGLILQRFYPTLLSIDENLLGLILLFFYIFIEPCMLSSIGTTPGKALFNIRLRKIDGTKLNLLEAFMRAFRVWIRGLGFGFPLITLFTINHAYNKLTKEGITSWDKEGGFHVSHKLVGAGRVLMAIIIFYSYIILVDIGRSIVKMK